MSVKFVPINKVSVPFIRHVKGPYDNSFKCTFLTFKGSLVTYEGKTYKIKIY